MLQPMHSVFSCIRTEYGDLWSKVRIQFENTDQRKLRIWTFHAVKCRKNDETKHLRWSFFL